MNTASTTSFTFKNIFGYGDDYNYTLNVPEKSVEILDRCQSIYDKILDFFSSEERTQDELAGAYKILEELFNDETALFIRQNFASYPSNIYLEYLEERIDKSDVVTNILLGKDNQNKNAFLSIFVSMLFYSFFEFNGSKTIYSYDCNDGIKIADNIYLKLKGYNGYKINQNIGGFYNMLCVLYPAWDNQKSFLISDFTKQRGILTKDFLTNGLIEYSSDGYKVISLLFPEDEEYVYNFNGFINHAIFNSSVETSRFNTLETRGDQQTCTGSVTLNIGGSLLKYFYPKIKEVIGTVLTNTEANFDNDTNTDNDTFQLTIVDYDTISRSGSNDKYLNFYIKLYNEAIKTLNEYIENIKKNSDAENKKKALEEDENIKKIIDSIVGTIKTGNNLTIEFDKNFDFKLNYFDYKNNGEFIANTILGGNNNITCFYDGKLSSIKAENIKKEKKSYKLNNSQIKYPKADYDAVLKNKDRLNSYINSSFYFYEESIFEDVGFFKMNTRDKIYYLETMSENILFKLTIFLYYKLLKDETNFKFNKYQYQTQTEYVLVPEQHYGTEFEGVSYTLKSRYTVKDAKHVSINDEFFYSIVDVYNFLGERLVQTIIKTLDVEVSKVNSEINGNEADINNKSYNDYVKQRLSGKYYTEKDYFYIGPENNKRLPNNPFVDIEFKILEYDENGNNPIDTWVPVTSVRNPKNVEDEFYKNKDQEAREVHAGTYFDSLEITDNGGIKEINLVLKSGNDINLENIIFNSLSTNNKKIELLEKESNINTIFGELDSMVTRSEAHFRVRFGYRDISRTDNNNNPTAIVTSHSDSNDFINRTKLSEGGKPLPVEIYPWTYFTITGLDSEIESGQDTYTIKGISSGAYLLKNFTVCGIPKSFSDNATDEAYYGRPKNVIGKLAKWIMEASSEKDESGERNLNTARICFLGDQEGTIINDVTWNQSSQTNEFKAEYKYVLENNGKFKGGDIETIENSFYDASVKTEEGGISKLAAKNFILKSDARTLSVQEILDNLMTWLPSRVYYIGKVGEGNNEKTAAIWLPYESIYSIDNFFEKYPFKTEKLKYQILEANAQIYKGNVPSELKFQKTYFIRVYFEGPGMSIKEGDGSENIEAEEYLRIYNYRSLQQQVIENISISCPNDSEIGQTISSVSLLGSGQSLVYSFNKDTGTINEDCASITNGNTKSQSANMFLNSEATVDKTKTWDYMNSPSKIKPYFAFNNSKYIFLNSNTTTNQSFPTTESAFREEATRFFTDLQNKQYTGEMTIIGDPFYYFDSSLTPAKYEIFLQMNRSKDSKTYQNIRSRYTGIYYITGIRHSIDSEGKFRTTLSLNKRVFGNTTSTTEEEKSDDSKKE